VAAWHQATKHPEAAPFYATDSQLGALPPTLMIVRALVGHSIQFGIRNISTQHLELTWREMSNINVLYHLT
jgi:hypothetical protein